MFPEDSDGMANSIDPEQTEGAVWSASTLFAETVCLKTWDYYSRFYFMLQ